MENLFCLGFNHGCIAEGHTEAAMCVKWWFQKFYLRILKSITCLGFSNAEEFYQSGHFGCFWWNFSINNPICCTYQNLCMTLTNGFGFLLHFSTSWKSCVKEQWPKKSLLYSSPRNHDRWLRLQRTNKAEYVFSFYLTNQELKQ